MYKELNMQVLHRFTQVLKVLYVEDNKESREAFQALLSNFFSDITISVNGKDALEKFNNHQFDLIITDIRMPKISGLELMKNIRQIDEEIPIIVSTAHQESELLIECIELGVNGYLLKPINHKQLLRIVKFVCGRLYYMEETKKYERSLEKLVKERTQELENIQLHLTQITHKDPLTNLYNRRYFNEIATTLMHISHREKSALSLLMIDIDRFKYINDTYGHISGDLVLKKLATILTFNTRNSDVVIRYGGEEFLILLPNTAKEGALSIANKIRESVEQTDILLHNTHNDIVNLTVSIGVVQCKCIHNKNVNTFVNHADIAMYRAKKSGRNRVVVEHE